MAFSSLLRRGDGGVVELPLVVLGSRLRGLPLVPEGVVRAVCLVRGLAVGPASLTQTKHAQART